MSYGGDNLAGFAAYAISHNGGPHGEKTKQMTLDYMKHKMEDGSIHSDPL